VVLHDLAVPGSRANIDHLVIKPGGVFVIDSKQYRERLQLDRFGGCSTAATLRPLHWACCSGTRVAT
jgi:Nuclease-related domain